MLDIMPAATLIRQPGYIQTTDGVNLFYRDWGSGKPLLFLSGWTRSLRRCGPNR